MTGSICSTNMNKIIILLYAMSISSLYFAQDPLFNQTDNSRNYLNPAYIGTEKSFAADISYRNQWPELSGSYKTLAVQVNQYLGKGNGVSLSFLNDNAGEIIEKSEFGVGYAKQFSVNDKHHISLGTQLSYFQKTLHWDKYTFGTLIDPQTGFVYDSVERRKGEGPVGFDVNLGVLYYSNHFFVGYSACHIPQPNESFDGGVSKLPIRHSVEVGGKIAFNQVTLIPSLRLFSQASFKTVFANLNVRYKFIDLVGGVNFGNGVFGGVGFVSDHFNIGYNYTSSINRMIGSVSTHEIRLGCDFALFNKENEYFFDF